MTLVLKPDLDMVKMYYHTKNEVSMSSHSKVIARMNRHTDRHTGRQCENITFLRTRELITVNLRLKGTLLSRDSYFHIRIFP